LIETWNLSPLDARLAMEEQGYEDHLALREEKGKNEGRQEEKQAIARSMLAKGLEPAMIADVTGLPIEEIRALSADER